MTFFAKLPPRRVALEACGAWPAVMEPHPKAEYVTAPVQSPKLQNPPFETEPIHP